MIDIVQSTLEHIRTIEARDLEATYIEDLEKALEMSSVSRTVLCAGTIYLIWGIIPTQAGNYIWQIPSKDIPADYVRYARSIKDAITDISTQFPDLFTIVRDDAVHNRWMTFIGFRPDNLSTIDGINFITYRKI